MQAGGEGMAGAPENTPVQPPLLCWLVWADSLFYCIPDSQDETPEQRLRRTEEKLLEELSWEAEGGPRRGCRGWGQRVALL